MMIQAVLSLLMSLGIPKSVAPTVAPAIAAHARTRQEAVFMGVLGKHETNFSGRLIAGHCRVGECDSHYLADGTIEFRSIGAWQARAHWAGKLWAALPGNIDAQAQVAANMTRSALATCHGDARGAFAVLAGKSCSGWFKDLDARVRDYDRALKELGS